MVGYIVLLADFLKALDEETVTTIKRERKKKAITSSSSLKH